MKITALRVLLFCGLSHFWFAFSYFDLQYYSRKCWEKKTHIKLKQPVTNKNFNSIENNGETQSMNELETWYIESDSHSDITEVQKVTRLILFSTCC